MDATAQHSVVAFNTATESTNKIHDDTVARTLGFRGGLVPGVDVYAYLCHLPAKRWGIDWLERGTMRARFHLPVYDGHRVEVTMDDGGVVTLRDEGGQACAEGVASLPEVAHECPDPARWPEVPLLDPDDRPDASPDSLSVGTAFALAPHGFHADHHREYLADVRESLPLYGDEGVAHPGWLLREANYVLSANVRLGPWIHVESEVVHHAAVRDGQVVSARAVVTREWERKGHRFVALDVLHLADGEPAARTQHTAIYKPRGV